MCCSSEKYSFIFSISAGNKNDAAEGRKLIRKISSKNKHYLIADRAYEDNKTRRLSRRQGFIFVIPPKKNRKMHFAMIFDAILMRTHSKRNFNFGWNK